MTEAARMYGGSLYELAVEEGLSEQLLEQTRTVRDLFEQNPQYVRLLSEPSIPGKERCGLIEEAFGSQAERYLVNFLKLLCDRNLLNQYGGCCDEYVRRYNADHQILEATVTSAVSLSEKQMEALKERLEKVSGSRIHLTQITDAGVIGGLRVDLDGRQLDGTVQGRLAGIARKLNEATIAELPS